VKLVEKFWSMREGRYGWLGGRYRDVVIVDRVNQSVRYLLHGKNIATWYYSDNKLEVYDHYYLTQTTYSRLNAILKRVGFSAFRKYEGFICDEKRKLYYMMSAYGLLIDLGTRNVTILGIEPAVYLDEESFKIAEHLHRTLRRYGVSFRGICSGDIGIDLSNRRLRKTTKEMIAYMALKTRLLNDDFSMVGFYGSAVLQGV